MLLAALVVLGTLAPAPGATQSRHGDPIASVRAQTSLRAAAWRGGQALVPSRSVSQLLTAQAQTPDRRLDLLFGARARFDAGLDASDPHPLLADAQLRPTLDSASIGARPLPALALRAGRLVTPGPAPARIDGVSVHLGAARGPFATASAGLRSAPRAAAPSFDPWAPPPEPLRDEAQDARLLRAALGWRTTAAAGETWLALDSPRGGRASTRTVGVAARATARSGSGLDLVAALDTLRLAPSHLRARGGLRVAETARLGLSAEYRAQLFGADTLWAIFPVSTSRGAALEVDVRAARATIAVDLGARARAETPWGAHGDVRVSIQRARYRGRMALGGELAPHLQRVSVDARLGTPVGRGHELEAGGLTAAADDGRGALVAARAWVAATLRASEWARVTLRGHAGADAWTGPSLGVVALADVRLPLRRSARRLAEGDAPGIPADRDR